MTGVQTCALPISDRAAALAALRAADVARPAEVFWLTDGIQSPAVGATEEPAARELADALDALGTLHVLTDENANLGMALAAPISAGNDLTFVVRRASTAGLASVWVRASADRGQLLHRQQIEFPAGATEASLTLDLPSELRNRIVRVELEQQRSAASIALLDERWRRRPVGLVSGESLEADQPLLSGLYYVERALQPYADLRHGTVSALLERELSVMVLADVGRLVGADRTALTTWVQEGGILVRFAGPHLAAESDDLLPVALQIGRAHV